MTITRTVRVTRQKTAHPTLSPGNHVWIRIGGYLKRCAPHPPKVAGSFPTNTPGWQGPSNATARDLATLVGGAGLEPATSSMSRGYQHHQRVSTSGNEGHISSPQMRRSVNFVHALTLVVIPCFSLLFRA